MSVRKSKYLVISPWLVGCKGLPTTRCQSPNSSSAAWLSPLHTLWPSFTEGPSGNNNSTFAQKYLSPTEISGDLKWPIIMKSAQEAESQPLLARFFKASSYLWLHSILQTSLGGCAPITKERPLQQGEVKTRSRKEATHVFPSLSLSLSPPSPSLSISFYLSLLHILREEIY